jgi:uncharacterized membrane protein
MTFNAAILPPWLTLLLGLAMLLTLGVALRFADWRALRAVPARLHLILGAVVFCLGLWLLGADVADTVRIHLLGMTAVTLVLGWCFAMQSGTVALLLLLLLNGQPLATLPAAWLCSVAVPATISRLLVIRLARIRRKNLFMYTLGGGFAGGMLATLAAGLSALAVLWLSDQQSLVAGALENWPFISLILFPEGFINGMLLTAICVFHPGAVKTFDDRVYIDQS